MSLEAIYEAAQIIHASRHLAVLTGAGVSKESGVPTFREAQSGLWAQYDPEELATPSAFRANPKLVWEWYEWRRSLLRKAKPNLGHYALAALEKRKPDMQIITQNVDDLHEQAGSRHVIHLHGNIAQSKCSRNCQGAPTLVDVNSLEWDRAMGPPPCPYCGQEVRPDVVWFGETLPADELGAAKIASVECDLMLVVGTSGLVSPASSIPDYAKQSGATIIEINPDYSMITRIADIKLAGPSGDILPRLVEAIDTLE